MSWPCLCYSRTRSLCFHSFSNYSTPLSKLGGHFLKVLEACPVSRDGQKDQSQDRAVSSHLLTSGRPCTLLGSFLRKAMTNPDMTGV